jgi:hypothetical protein
MVEFWHLRSLSEIIKKNIYLTFQWLCWILYLYKQFLRLGQNIPLSYSLLLSHNVVSSTPLWTGFALTTLVVIGTDCTGSCKFYYHTITITTAPINCQWHYLLIICFKWWRSVLYACNVSVFKIDLILMLVWTEMKTTDYHLSWSAMCVPQ